MAATLLQHMDPVSPSRSDAEAKLAEAVSRYVGYTTGATYLDRIASLTRQLASKPFRYQVEIVREIQESWDLTEKTAKGVVDFAVSLGLLRRYEGGGAHPRLSLSSLGRAYRGAESHGDPHYRTFVLSFLLLKYDADLYALQLDLYDQPPPRGSDWNAEFKRLVHGIREKRLEWLHNALGADILVRRVAENVRWLDASGREIEILPVGDDFVRHHTTPRKGWAKEVKHISDAGSVTEEAKVLLHRLRAGRPRYYWIGPNATTLKALRIPVEQAPAPLEPVWEIFRPTEAAEAAAPQAVVDEIGRFMIDRYEQLRLLRTNQAPMEAVQPYLYWCERQSNRRYDEGQLFREVFGRFAEELAPLSGRGKKIGHYQLRTAP